MAIFAWLMIGRFPDLKGAAKAVPIVGSLVDYLLSFEPPQVGVRWVALTAMCGLTAFIWGMGSKLASAYEDALKTPDKFALLEGEPLHIFVTRAKVIERARTTWIFFAVLLSYSSVLHYAILWYPAKIGTLLSAWLVGLL